MTTVTRILAIEHEAQCPPAHVGTWLTEAGAAIDVCRPWAGDELPALASYDGLVVLGGSMGADDDALHHWLAPVKQMVREAVDTGAIHPERAVHTGLKPDDAATAFSEARSVPGKSWIDLTGWLPQPRA